MPVEILRLLLSARLLLLACSIAAAVAAAVEDKQLAIPFVGKDIARSPQQLHAALLPAWEALVEHRNEAGLVPPKDEGKPSTPLSQSETAFQYDRVQKGQVDSARLLLVFGLVPSASHVDEATLRLLRLSAPEEDSGDGHGGVENLPATFDVRQRFVDGSTPLHMAATFGNIHAVTSLLEAKADVKATSNTGLQPIHVASIAGHADVIEALVNYKADVDARHSFAGNTPLHFAAEMGHAGTVRMLCQLSANANAKKAQGGTPLHTAADSNNSNVVRVLLSDPCNADVEALMLGDTVPLYLAAGRGFASVIEALLDGGANPDRTLRQREPRPRRGSSAGSGSGAQDSPELSGTWLEGSHPDAPGWEEGNGATSLHNACENGHIAAVRSLLQGKARQLPTMQGVTPLITALQYRHRRVAAELFQAESVTNVHVANPLDGQVALHLAAAYDYPEIVARILVNGGDVDAVDKRGNRPGDYSRSALVQWLLRFFMGRSLLLDTQVAARMAGEDKEITDFNVLGAAESSADTYARFYRLHEAGDLLEEVQRIASALKTAEATAVERLIRQLNVARFIQSAASNANLAVEALLRFESAEGVEVGLVLLEVTGIAKITYKSGDGKPRKLRINGRDCLAEVTSIIDAGLQSAELGSMLEFYEAVKRLVQKLGCAPPPWLLRQVQFDVLEAAHQPAKPNTFEEL